MRTALVATVLGASLTVATAARADGIMYPGDYLFGGQGIVSTGCYYHLDMQLDGNLVVYAGAGGSPSQKIFSTSTNAHQVCPSDPLAPWGLTSCSETQPGWYATLQADDNFVVYGNYDTVLWASNTNDSTAYQELNMQNDGNLVLYRWNQETDSWASRWSSATAGAQVNGDPCVEQTNITTVAANENRLGGDFATTFELDWHACGQDCARDAPQCEAWTWVPSTQVCWMKSSIPGPSSASGMVSGYIHH